MTRLIATFGFVGLLPGAPGTFGSLAALPVAWLLMAAGGPWSLAAAAGLVCAVGWWATAVETAGAPDHDPGAIVIDEVAGQWIALLPLAFGATLPGPGPWVGLVVGFVLFRAFDILKPFPVSWADRMATPLGVMLDDVLAGGMAAMVFWGIAWMLS